MDDVRPKTQTSPEGHAGARRSEDAELMQAVARHDPRAEREFVERIVARVRRATGALLREPADADDAAQLCMLELLKSAGSFRAEGRLESWCDRIVVRTTMRYTRKQARTRHLVDASADPDTLRTSQDERRRSDEIAGEVRQYLEALPPARREALVLRHVLDHSVDEIAALTGVSSNTVKDRLVTARREFRKMLRREKVIGDVSARTGRTDLRTA